MRLNLPENKSFRRVQEYIGDGDPADAERSIGGYCVEEAGCSVN